jgi:hypothetical protein
LAEQIGVERQELRELRIRPLCRHSCVEQTSAFLEVVAERVRNAEGTRHKFQSRRNEGNWFRHAKISLIRRNMNDVGDGAS